MDGAGGRRGAGAGPGVLLLDDVGPHPSRRQPSARGEGRKVLNRDAVERIRGMREIYLLNVTLHVLAAMLWLGGMLSLALVGAPVLRQVDPPALRAELFTRIGRRLRGVGWGAIA